MNTPHTLKYMDCTYIHRYQPGLTNVTEKNVISLCLSPSQLLLSTPIFNSVVNPLKLLSKFNLPTVFFQPFKLSFFPLSKVEIRAHISLSSNMAYRPPGSLKSRRDLLQLFKTAGPSFSKCWIFSKITTWPRVKMNSSQQEHIYWAPYFNLFPVF